MKKLYNTFVICISILFGNAQTWQDVGGGLNSSSHGMCLWNNMLIDGGSFGSPCPRVAGWNGTNWICFGNGVGLVARACVEYNGDLIVCGDFWNINQPCTNCNGIAKWDGTQWTALGTGFNNDVLCLTVWNGQLVAGGDFTTADGNPCDRVAVWNGTNWYSLGGFTTTFDNDVRALTMYNGELWAGGDFSNAGGCTACDRIVKWNGSAWVGGNSGVDIPGGLDSTVRVLYVNPTENKLYLGGHFLEVGGNTACSGVAVYDGSVWSPLGTGVNNYVRAITYYNGNIIVGGDFTNASGVAANKIAKWNPSTGAWSAMGTGMNDYVKALQVYNGELYAGGPFTTADGLPRSCVAKWYETPAVPPVASFSASSNAICLNQCISLTDLSTNTPTQWNWTFTGGTPASSTLQNPGNICYNTPGTYTISLQACNVNGCNTVTQTINVSSNPQPVVTATPANPVICSGNNTNLSASGAITYSWSPATGLSTTTGSSVTANPAITTMYYVTGNSLGCTNTDSVLVTVNPTPIVAVSPGFISICPTTSATVSASGATSYNWSPSTGLNNTTSATVIASPSATTTYTVTGTTNGCSSSATVTVSTAGGSPLPLMEGFEVTPSLPAAWSLTDGGNDTYTWQHNSAVGGFGASSSSYWFENNAVNAPGTKDELITDKYNFTSLTSVKLFFDVAYCRKSNASFSDTLVVYASTDCGQTWNQIYSKGGSTLATAPNQNGAFTPTAAQWRTDTVYLNSYIGQSNVLFSFQNRNYNGNNLYLDNINISGINNNPPVAAINVANNTVCAGSCMTVNDNSTGLPTSWSWTFTGASPASSTTQNPGNVCYSTPGTYTISLQSCNANGCDTTSTIITVLPLPVANAGADVNICNGGSVTLNSTGGVSYSWSPAVSLSCSTCPNPTSSATSTTAYTVTVTDVNGCAATDDIMVTVSPSPVAAAGTDVTLCNGSSVQLNGTGGTSYTWSPATSLSCSTCFNPSSSATSTTTYTLTVTDANGCTDTDDIMVTVVQPPIAMAGTDTTICEGESVQLNGAGGGTYSWTPSADLSCSSCQNPVASPTVTTIYSVTVTDANNCSATDAINVTVDPCLGISSVDANAFAVYPNPANTEITVVSTLEMQELTLRNLLGETLISKQENSKQAILDLSDLAAGVYFIQVNTEKGNSIERILIER